jgi:two-component system NtrC family sensor kinase
MNTVTEEKIEAFIWDNKFNTGVDVVDEQHRKLVDLINRLGSISAHLTSTTELGEILTELANYTVYHFNTEEDLMKQYAVDAGHQDVHIKAHHHFIDQVTVAAKILMGSSDVNNQLVAPLLKYLTNWLVQHILGSDARMGKEILALQAGDSHDDAVRKANAFMTQSANVLMEALNEMYGKLGDKTLEVMKKNQELEAEHGALKVLNDQLEERVKQRTAAVEQANQQLLANNLQLKQLNEKLESAHTQLLQSEKMASIGQLAAGVAHEINNPIGYVHSNMASLDKYLRDIFGLLEAYERLEALVGERQAQEVTQLKQAVDLGFMRQDIVELMKESRDGIGRVKKIVQDLKDFSHQGGGEQWQWAHLHDCLESAHNIANSEIKYKAKVVKEYGEIPDIQCLPSQLNQVFVNLLVNAAQAIDQNGAITLRTGAANEQVWVEISDTGQGIAPENLNRIFDPFFTTKPVGTGTGLGLSLSYSIVEKHGGRIEDRSELGKGTTFRIELPARQETIAA